MDAETIARLETAEREAKERREQDNQRIAAAEERAQKAEEALTLMRGENEKLTGKVDQVLARLGAVEDKPAAIPEGRRPVQSAAHADRGAIERQFGTPGLPQGTEPGPTVAELQAEYERLLHPTEREKAAEVAREFTTAEALRQHRMTAINLVKHQLYDRGVSP